MRLFYLFFTFLLFSSFVVSASLGISPAKKEIDFVPGEVHTFNFVVSDDNPENILKIYFAGDLAEYATSSVDTLIGSGEVIVRLELPNSIDTPGDHALYVRAIESPSEGDVLGSRIDIGAYIRVFVPYPGHYPVISLDFPDGNRGEIIPITFSISNKGTQPLSLERSKIGIYSSATSVETLDLPDVDLSFAESYDYKYLFNSSNLLPGEYFSTATTETPEVWQVNDTFRIGSLFMNVTYFTTNLTGNSIQPFFVNVQNLWNNRINGVYADVNITNSSGHSVTYMRTPSADFDKWDQKVLQGFIDTNGLKGNYTAIIELRYLDKSTYVSGQFFVFSVNYLLYSIVALAIAIVLFVVYYLVRRGSKK